MLEQNKVFFPDLDGLRFFAFFAVFINHAFGCLGYQNRGLHYNFVREDFLLNGDLGVNFFFVLSGFLITYLLLKEKEITGKINIKNFYLRRVLRIWPLYFFIVFLCLVIFPLFKNSLAPGFPIGVKTDELNPWFYLTFTGNFEYIYHGITNVLIGVLWSVSVEEQFYLFWPLLIFLIPKKYLLPVFIALIMGSTAYRFYYACGNAVLIKFHSFSSVSDLSTGALIAYLATRQKFIDRMKRIPKYVIILIYCFGFTLFPFREYTWKFGIYYTHASSLAPVIFSLFFAFIIIEQCYAEHSFYKIGRSKRISSLGKYTYGMYCYHMIVFFLVMYGMYAMGITTAKMNKYIFTGVMCASMILVILVSKLSYTYFESRFLRLKNRFAVIVKE